MRMRLHTTHRRAVYSLSTWIPTKVSEQKDSQKNVINLNIVRILNGGQMILNYYVSVLA
jgi:hypothetical protein